MIRALLTILCASAVYGYAIGSVHSPRIASWSLAKFPMLVFVTCSICALAYFAFTLLVTRELTLRDVTRVSLRTFADMSVLLAALAPVSFFLALTVDQPTSASLEEYPLFVGINVILIACAGSVALLRHTLRLAREYELGMRKSVLVVTAWLAISLFAGGQCAWAMRPFFGARTVQMKRFMEWTDPDWRGATSFYEAVWHLLAPPPPPRRWATPRSSRAFGLSASLESAAAAVARLLIRRWRVSASPTGRLVIPFTTTDPPR